MLSGADLRYLSEQFVPLADLCDDVEDARRRIASGDLPALPYPGLEFVPADYFELPLGDSFAERYRGDDLADDLDGLMSGMYFVCLREATPENIVRKDRLVTSVRALLAEPRPDNSTWCAALRSQVDELDELERPFSPDYDRQRFGRPTTRDELIAEPRRRYPDAF
jgi:Family of unknown function (DUF6058)